MQTVVDLTEQMSQDVEPPEPPADDDDGNGDDDQPGDESWVTVRTFWEPVGAHLALAQLESGGVEGVLLDENIVAADWMMANAVGGIKLKVRASDAAEADQILTPRSGIKELPPAAESLTGATACCPRCQSDEIYQESIWRRPAVILLFGATVASFGLLLLIVLPWILALPRNWRCLHCGHEWLSHRRGFGVESKPNSPANSLDPASEL